MINQVQFTEACVYRANANAIIHMYIYRSDNGETLEEMCELFIRSSYELDIVNTTHWFMLWVCLVYIK